MYHYVYKLGVDLKASDIMPLLVILLQADTNAALRQK